MASKAITIYTPPETAPHIGAQDDAFIYDTLLGGRSGVLGDLTCTASDANTLTLSGGGVSNRGYVMYVPAGETQTLTVPSCEQGLWRIDIVAAAFTKGGGTTADTHVFTVIRGEESDDPTEPEVESTAPEAAGDVSRTALFRVFVGGDGIVDVMTLAQDAVAAGAMSPELDVLIDGDVSGEGFAADPKTLQLSLTVNRIGGKTVYIQQEEPLTAEVGDLWIW